MQSIEITPVGPQADCACAGAAVLDEEAARSIAGVAKALSDPVRLRLYARIVAAGAESLCACAMPEELGVSQPTLSHHLKRLVDAGLVTKEMRGRWAHFTAVPGAADGLIALLPTRLGAAA